ncbi:MAG TPA: TerB family tellurite resistance protein [Kofleriaceae bacterium]
MTLLGGALRPNDPRRFLIEAMVGAMTADGVVSPSEHAAMERTIAKHPLFAGLGAAASHTLIELSKDAIRFAGGSVARVQSIAKGLPARIHRIAAYGMAAEIAVADDVLEEGELSFLEALRLALRVSPLEAESIVAAAQAGELEPFVADRYLRIKSMISLAAEVFALRALGRGMATDDQRFAVRDFFAAIPDLAMSRDELDTELYRAFRRPREPNAEVFTELSRVAQTLPDPVDRYWMVVYALVAEIPATVASWRVIPFVGVMQAAFQIVDTDMELAVVDALTFPAAMPRPP